MPSYKIYYFDARGRAETARLMFENSGTAYEDIRYTREQWPSHKPEMPFGQMPVLEIDNVKYGQSIAMFNHLARELNYYGSNNIEKLRIDQIVQCQADTMQAGGKIMFEKDEAKKAEMAKSYGENDLPRLLNFLKEELKKSKSGFLVGSSVSLADFLIFDFLFAIKNYDALKKLTDGMWEKYPELKTHHDKIANLPKIKAYIEKRKQTPF